MFKLEADETERSAGNCCHTFYRHISDEYWDYRVLFICILRLVYLLGGGAEKEGEEESQADSLLSA